MTRATEVLHSMRDLIKIKANNREDYSALFTEYISNLSEEQKLEKDNADFIFNQTQGLQSPGLKVLKDYESYFKDIKGEDAYNAKLISIASQVANTAIKQKNLEEVNKAISFLKTYKPNNYKEVSSEFLVNYYGNAQRLDTI
jgi:predicted transcriptional regulator